MGHTAADADAAASAFDAGASILTHAFNAMPGLHHRAPGPVGAALADPRVTLEIIADGIHLDPRIVASPSPPRRADRPRDGCDGRRGPPRTGTIDSAGEKSRWWAASPASRGGDARGLDADAGCRAAARGRGGRGAARCRGRGDVDTRADPGRGHDLGALAPGYLADAVLLDADLRVARVWASPLP